jgi:excisionase family DNA binding protein
MDRYPGGRFRYVEVTPAARRLGVSKDWVRRAVDAGRVLAIRTASGQRLVDVDDLERLALERERGDPKRAVISIRGKVALRS